MQLVRRQLEQQRIVQAVELGRTATYTIGFFLFWAFASASSALTCLLQRSPFEVNRCPLPQQERPAACPRNEERGGGS